MTLVSYVNDAVYQERLKSPQVANLLRVVFHSPDWAEAFVRLGVAQMGVLSLPPLDRELVTLLTGYRLGADYVVAQHEGLVDSLGFTREQRGALQNRQVETELFSDRQKALFRFVETLLYRDYPNDRALADARAVFTEAELVEIIGVQGFAATISAFTRTFQIEIDPVGAQDLLQFSRTVAPAQVSAN